MTDRLNPDPRFFEGGGMQSEAHDAIIIASNAGWLG
jgi:hypothetical protein